MHVLLKVMFYKLVYTLKDSLKVAGQLEDYSDSKGMQISF